jgi:uncharacterized protein YggU (UPF0235/DUF167 family)
MHITVSVKTGARKEAVEKVSDSRYKITVREEAERNEANERVVQIISRELQVPAAKVRIVSGHHKPAKLVAIDI